MQAMFLVKTLLAEPLHAFLSGAVSNFVLPGALQEICRDLMSKQQSAENKKFNSECIYGEQQLLKLQELHACRDASADKILDQELDARMDASVVKIQVMRIRGSFTAVGRFNSVSRQ
jgi:hypothetical protein